MGLLDKASNAVDSKSALSGQNSSTEALFVEEEIARFHKINPEFKCIVLEAHSSAGEKDKANFCKTVSEMINTAGVVIPLSPGRPLVLFPKAIDLELIAHRLSKSLGAKSLLSFEANSSESVLARIKSMT